MLHKLQLGHSSACLGHFISAISALRLNKLASPQKSSNPQVADDHLLPASSSTNDAVKLDVGQSAASLKHDALGPLVVNSDGVSTADDGRGLNEHVLTSSLPSIQTLSRITNWPEMTPAERERTFRVLVARNR